MDLAALPDKNVAAQNARARVAHSKCVEKVSRFRFYSDVALVDVCLTPKSLIMDVGSVSP